MGRGAKISEQHTFNIADTNGILLGAAVFNSGPQFARGYAEVFGHGRADQAGTAFVEQGRDAINWDISDSVAVAANTTVRWNIAIKSRYVRVRWVNGAVAQGTFRFYSSFIRIRSPNPEGFDLGPIATPVAGTPPGINATPNDAIAANTLSNAAAAGLRFMGFAARETAGAVSAWKIEHGAVAGSPNICPFRLAANESTSDFFWPGILTPNGIFLERLSGTADITIYQAVV